MQVGDYVRVVDKQCAHYGQLGLVHKLNFLGREGYHCVIILDICVYHESQLELIKNS